MNRSSPRVGRKLLSGVVALACLSALAGCTDAEPEVGSFCDELRQAPSLATIFTGFAEQDAFRLDDQLDEAAAQYGDLRKAAPDQIEPDVDLTVDLVEAVIAAVRADRDDPAAAADSVRSVIAEFPDAETSALAVADYARSECDVELNPGQNTGVDDGTGADDRNDGTVPPAEEGEDGSVTGGM